MRMSLAGTNLSNEQPLRARHSAMRSRCAGTRTKATLAGSWSQCALNRLGVRTFHEPALGAPSFTRLTAFGYHRFCRKSKADQRSALQVHAAGGTSDRGFMVPMRAKSSGVRPFHEPTVGRAAVPRRRLFPGRRLATRQRRPTRFMVPMRAKSARRPGFP